jgi:hypothetical protein
VTGAPGYDAVAMLTASRPSTAGGDVATSRARVALRRWSGAGGVFGISFAALLTLLLVRNNRVFTGPVYPRGDSAANAIVAEQAKHFDLLVGHYSRVGFSHPGPAFLYWQAFGEWLFHDLLGLVPGAWNGQWLALLILNAALVALTLAILRSWSDSWQPVAWCGTVVLVFLASHDNLLSSTWMPYALLPPFLLLLTAGASVAAGRPAWLWAMALAGGLLVHGHAEFLFFVPVISAVALGLAGWRRASGERRDWLLFSAVVALFLLPIALNLALHWPGEFGKYFSYGGEGHAHGAGASVRYVLDFWAGHPAAGAVLAVLLTAGIAWLWLARPPGGQRPFLLAGLGMGLLATVLFAGYAARGIDDLSQQYVGYFYWAVPLFLLLLAMLGLGGVRPEAVRLSARLRTVRLPVRLRTVRLPRRLRNARFGALRPGRHAAGLAALVGLLGALAVAGRSPALATAPEDLPDLPRAMDTLSAYAGGRPLVVELEQGAWPVLTALIVQGQRTGRRVCARDPGWRFLVTAEFVCTGREVAEGRQVRLAARPATGPDTQPPSGAGVLAELDGVVVTG